MVLRRKPSQNSRPISVLFDSRNRSKASRTPTRQPKTSTPPTGTSGCTNRLYSRQNRLADSDCRSGSPRVSRVPIVMSTSSCSSVRKNDMISSGGSWRSAASTAENGRGQTLTQDRIAAVRRSIDDEHDLELVVELGGDRLQRGKQRVQRLLVSIDRNDQRIAGAGQRGGAVAFVPSDHSATPPSMIR